MLLAPTLLAVLGHPFPTCSKARSLLGIPSWPRLRGCVVPLSVGSCLWVSPCVGVRH